MFFPKGTSVNLKSIKKSFSRFMIKEKYTHLNSKFYTIDFAELQDGSWIVIEAGDGSVSGLSDFQDYDEFFRKLFYSFL